MKEQMIDSFNRIALLEDKWDHNQHYEKLIMSEIDAHAATALDIGCGTGEFAYRLASNVKKVKGIDISNVMIEEAIKRHSNANIHYTCTDFDHIDESEQYDCIVSIATFHHLNLDTTLPKVKRLLKKNGVFIVLDLYERQGLYDRLLDLLAIPANIFLKKIKLGRIKDTPEEIAAWTEHSKLDVYMTYPELKKVYREAFGNNVKIKRLLFWRYLMVYKHK